MRWFAFGFAAGSLLLHVHVPIGALAPLALVILVTAVSCTGLGLVNGAIGLRVRESAVSSNIVFGLLLVLCGVNVPLHELPGWMEVIGRGLPLTHGIQAARELTDGAGLSDVVGLVGTEALIGLVWGVLGCTMLRLLGFEARRRATLETA